MSYFTLTACRRRDTQYSNLDRYLPLSQKCPLDNVKFGWLFLQKSLRDLIMKTLSILLQYCFQSLSISLLRMLASELPRYLHLWVLKSLSTLSSNIQLYPCRKTISENRGFFFFKILFIYSWETQRGRGRDTGRRRSRLHIGSPMWDSILGLQDHTPGGWQR